MKVRVTFVTALLLAGCALPGVAQSTARTSEVASALRQVCPNQQLTRSRDGQFDGCIACPTQTGMAQDWSGGWLLRRETSGPLTAAGAHDLLLSGIGCEPHSEYFGGSFLFHVRHGKAKLVSYSEGLIADHCVTARAADGRDLLVCRTEWGGQGTVWSSVVAVRFGRAGQAEVTKLLTVTDTVAACGVQTYSPDQGEHVDTRVTSMVRRAQVTDFRFVPGRDLSGRLQVTLTAGRKRLNRAERHTCDRQRGTVGPIRLADLLQVRAQRVRVVFLFDGKEFGVAPGSRGTLARVTEAGGE